MPTVTGTLRSILNFDPEVGVGSVEVALCGYGSQVPRMNGQGIAARVTDDSAEVAPDGSFEFELTGNDEIQPPGTYYTVTVKDDNGDIVQVNAYQFASTQDEYDLEETAPFDPSGAIPPAIPPLILGLLLVIPFDPAANFPGDVYTSWLFELAGDCNPTFTNLVDGNLYTVIVEQTGSFAFNWPSNVANATSVQDYPGVSIQTFVALENELFPIGPATYYP